MTKKGNPPGDAPAEGGAPRSGGADYPMLGLREGMDRLFEDFLRELAPPFRWRGFGFGPFGQMETEFRSMGEVMPRADYLEGEDADVITVELPGVDEDDVTVSLVEDQLVVEGEKPRRYATDSGRLRLGERRYGTIRRSFRVSETVDPEGISASFGNGILTITLPKRAGGAGKAKRVPVQGD